ncbi:peptidase S8 and S53 subtilisin kexin sedolisin [Hymenobacter roseosalivarius DSM 11622]|uniref:Peptidase S8 and S53 subtilisin kexin sedolisin n=1 Tax=Hymenobacter roseosalivarius DSM 11622 TaxID=645990 RepID=A0A1W1VXA3_9BACT|nr:S8 family peptidase [Hymenobacter roseosalivarius]SMB98012.1 peptidase S8 and S53 subtilisin kexin sedolisin [Hymenobacter roseosalivarius DSM 11622]
MKKTLLGLLLWMGSSGAVLAQAFIDSHLKSALTNVAGVQQVVVTFQGDGAPTAANLQLLQTLGISQGVTLKALPVAGVLATREQIDLLAADPSVVSVFLNRSLTLDNEGATALTGAQRVRLEPSFTQRNGGLPVSGKGIGVVINDSGVDGTHPDLTLGKNLKQNVLGTTNLNAQDAMLPITYVENVPNTDQTGGHGTHVAGIVGATGAASNGKYAGVAPGADLIGYGTGAGLFILDVIGAFDYALVNQFQYNIRVITNSFGTTSDIGTEPNPSDPINIATKRCVDRNIVVVFSAGNSGSGSGTITGNYKKAPWVIAVANSDKAGVLAPSSSRGRKGVGGTVTINGQSFPWRDEPTITSPGTDIISTRTVSPIGVLSTQQDAAAIEPAFLPFYTHLTGTSMSAPHVAGVVALMLDANPNLTPLQVKTIIEQTATNLPNRESWEVGRGMVNAYAAVDRAFRQAGYGSTVNSTRTFNSSVNTNAATSAFTINYNPATTATNSRTFTVAPGTTSLEVSCKVSGLLGETGNPVNLVLLSPTGKRFASGISVLFAISPGRAVAVAGPEAGTWTVRLDGLQGVAFPETVNGTISLNQAAGSQGLNDVVGHPAEASIQMAISKRLMDGLSNGFKPEQDLSRIQLADYLVMGQAVRQFLPLDGAVSFGDVSATELLLAESVTAQGAALRDRKQVQNGVMQPLSAGKFSPSTAVTRASLAYSLVQSLGLQNKAQQIPSSVTVEVDGKRIAIDDADQIPADLRGYVQVALDMNIINAFYSVTQGPYDLRPVLHATFKPAQKVRRADFAVIVTRTHAQWNTAPVDAAAAQSAATTTDAQLAQRDLVLAAPNPFSDRTRFSYQLNEAGAVSLEVFDMMGRKVKTLVNGQEAAGWHEHSFDGTALPAGTYLFKLRAGAKNQSGRVVLTH